MPDYSQAFGPKSDVYAQYRWDYAAEAIDQVCALAGLGPGSTVADVGAGTGLLSAHFLRRGTRVVAVEPNAGMLQVAQQALGHEARFSALPGYAHATGLEAASVDLIAVGRALHWFDHAPTRAEFLRVLRPGGWLAVLQTPTTDPYLAQEMARLRTPETGWKMERSKHHLAQASLGFYFGTEDYQTLIVPGRVQETWEQFFGRVSSLSPAPNPGQPLYPVFERTARDIFERGAVNGLLPVEYSTTVTLHALKPATLAPTPTSTSHPAPLPFARDEVERSLGERFERVVARFPDRVALQAAGDTWTYTRLNEFADQVAHAVTALSPDPGRPIVLFFEHEPLAIGALLGVLKAGRAYCALRPNLPPARLRETVADLDAHVLLCSPGALAEAQALAAVPHVVNVRALPESDAPFLVPPVTPDTLGGVFYTSGTTGRPKGVMRSQGMLLHRAWSSSRLLGVTPHDHFSQCFGISFGASIVDIFVALLNGAALHPYAASQLGVAPLGAWLKQEQITVLHLPVAFYRQFLDGLTPDDHFPAVRRITPSGKLFWSDVARSRPHFAPECRLVSQFSSTETSLLTWMLVDPTEADQGTSVPVGLHLGLVNRLAWMWRAFPFLPGEVLAHKTTLSFLDSAWEIFGPLLAGVPSVVVPEAVLLDLPELVNTLARFQVSRLVLVPSLLRGLLERFPDLGERLPKLRLWTSSGETLPADLTQAFHRAVPEATLINLYGTTEVSADAACFVTRPDQALSDVPIGRPIANMQAHVLDAWRQPAPVGVPGELYLGGVGLALGYLGRPAQTAERFPTLPVASGEPRRLFRTGDRARWLPDGNLEYLGRADDQVKLRGMRVELGEIEAVLRQAPQVRQAAVAVAEQGGERVLAAYIVPHTRAGDEAQHAASLARHLTARLPRTMLPASYTFLAELPLTPSGKVDRPRLPAPHRAVGEAPPPSEADPVEARLCRVWEAVLGVAPIGPHDNFFALGGHSLHAFRLFAQIEKEFGQILPVVLLFESPTPAGLAVNLRTRRPPPASLNPAVIHIQPRGDRPPFFCVHGFGGGVLGYADLARGLGPDQPFFGLQALGFTGHAAPHTSIPEMAAYYLDQLRCLEPHGPYHLGGYCFGGVVAYEMACRLQAEGEQVGLLAVIEGFAPRRVREPLSFTNPRHVANFLRNLPFWLGDLLSLSAGQAAQQARGRLRLLLRRPASTLAGRLDRPLPAALLGEDARRVPAATRRLMELHILAQAAYQPPGYPGRLDLFRVQRLSLLRGHDPLLGWGKLAQGGVRVHLVAGRHNSLHQPPHVASLAAALRAALEASPFVFSVPD